MPSGRDNGVQRSDSMVVELVAALLGRFVAHPQGGQEVSQVFSDGAGEAQANGFLFSVAYLSSLCNEHLR